MLRRIFNNNFEKTFNGTIILDHSIEEKLIGKHKVYREDVADAISDPYRVVMRPRRKNVLSKNTLDSKGQLYELLCITSMNRILFLVGRLFSDGNFYIITSYWADQQLQHIYFQESEVPYEQEA